MTDIILSAEYLHKHGHLKHLEAEPILREAAEIMRARTKSVGAYVDNTEDDAPCCIVGSIFLAAGLTGLTLATPPGSWAKEEGLTAESLPVHQAVAAVNYVLGFPTSGRGKLIVWSDDMADTEMCVEALTKAASLAASRARL